MTTAAPACVRWPARLLALPKARWERRRPPKETAMPKTSLAGASGYERRSVCTAAFASCSAKVCTWVCSANVPTSSKSKAGMVLMWMPRANHGSALARGSQRGQHQFARRRDDQRRIEADGRRRSMEAGNMPGWTGARWSGSVSCVSGQVVEPLNERPVIDCQTSINGR